MISVGQLLIHKMMNRRNSNETYKLKKKTVSENPNKRGHSITGWKKTFVSGAQQWASGLISFILQK